ncbi:MAG: YkgJ family cysteine cluster protein [Polyangiaceae bacterium]
MIERPRLLDHVLTRRNRVTGEKPLVVLYDVEALVHHAVSERSHVVISAMDGTRDCDGLAAYARAEGLRMTTAEVRSFVDELAAAGLVGEGVASEGAASAENDYDNDSDSTPAAPRPRDDSADRPLLHQPGFALSCDGSGTCCRFYPSIAFTALDAARARAAQPLVEDGGYDERRIFLPLVGQRSSMRSVTLVDGRCAYLERDGRCAVHAAAGEGSKPLGCRTYPAHFVDDGAHIRVGPILECGCVLASGIAATPAGSALVAPETSKRRDLDPALFVQALPPRVVISRDGGVVREVARAEVVAWADGLADVSVTDAVAGLLALARSLGAAGLDVEASRAALRSTADAITQADRRAIAAAVNAIAPRVATLAAESWRGARDMVRQTASALDAACVLALDAMDELVAGPGAHVAVEQFYVRTALFNHTLVHLPPRSVSADWAPISMSTLAIDRAARVLLGRAMLVVRSLAELTDPAFAWPLALVEATMRGYGVSVYARELERALQESS